MTDRSRYRLGPPMCSPTRPCLSSCSFRRLQSCYLDSPLVLPLTMTPPMSKTPRFYSSFPLAHCSFHLIESRLERSSPLYPSRAQPEKVFEDGFHAYVVLGGDLRLGRSHCWMVCCAERRTFRRADLCLEYVDECSCAAGPRFQSPIRKYRQRDQRTPIPFPNKNNRVGTLL